MKFVLVEKVFLLLLVVIILFTAYRIIHTHTVLENTNSPTKVVHIFDLNNDLLYNIVTIFSMILLLLSNIFFWGVGSWCGVLRERNLGLCVFLFIVGFVVAIFGQALGILLNFYFGACGA